MELHALLVNGDKEFIAIDKDLIKDIDNVIKKIEWKGKEEFYQARIKLIEAKMWIFYHLKDMERMNKNEE